jgi:poly(3-hydroxybutyrate) depolymerase
MMRYLLTAPAWLGFLLAAAPVHAAETEADSVDRLVLRTATTHPIRYFFALPRGYTPSSSKQWPVLVALAGQSDNPSEETAQAYLEARGDLPFILVVPCTLTNVIHTPQATVKFQEYYPTLPLPDWPERQSWDEKGILAILDDLQAREDVQPRVYLTGFSSGGILTYHLIVRHPERLAGAVTVCGNFQDTGYRANRRTYPSETLALPIRIIVGEADPNRYVPYPSRGDQVFHLGLGMAAALVVGAVVLFWTKSRTLALAAVILFIGIAAAGVLLTVRNAGIEGQARAAERVLRELHYSDVQLILVPGMGHDASPQPVLEAFRSRWEN